MKMHTRDTVGDAGMTFKAIALITMDDRVVCGKPFNGAIHVNAGDSLEIKWKLSFHKQKEELCSKSERR